jgi:hypothetical protein
MPLSKLQIRSELLKKILDAFKDAESEGIKDPLMVLKKALKKRVNIKSNTSRPKSSK